MAAPIKQLNTDLPLNYILHESNTQHKNRVAVILLHGRAANELDLFDLAPEFSNAAIVLSPRAPIEMGIGEYGWFHTTYLADRTPIYDPNEAIHSRKVLFDFIRASQSKFQILPANTYLFGFSQGSIMALGLLFQNPRAVGGIAALSGRLLPEFSPPTASVGQFQDFPLLLSHGLSDEVLSIDFARSAKKELSKLPIDLEYFERQIGHDITEANFSDVRRWFINQTS